ncbi:hypothetical protein BFJ63_vAg8150 [Fusarium oxysporum f. sp. narcissi]|uniref:Uncharacterized protein n=3 Tax=Fusarium oxysporum TaxID=5507 RepID=A0A420S8A2_FUSOX|nr:hypothetical protein NW765_014713 [Fusarium oxysporum]RKK14763.1 hypothetical protein BFJ65_g11314 [Fusarium oxysporum f. sp. cepae]RYC89007.1 hypothetical protein BFJ63_vAg8150 [Fusarium oxysporum f. sp. narcissi]KAJ4274686.1 hypothetical protein NW764_011087 [Fusarium oxysporum]RKK53600.1 hypothetical protein BFJ66_g5057 [Fusarium oxysporum f. sp. cepae]
MDGSKGQSAQPSPGYVTSLQLSPLTTDLSLFSLGGFAYLTQYLLQYLTATAKLSYQRIFVSTGVFATTPSLRSPPPKNGDFLLRATAHVPWYA